MEQTGQTDIFASLHQQKQQATETATTDYWQLLGKLATSNPTTADQKKLAAAIEVLGKTPEDARKDHQMILNAKTDLLFIREHQDAQLQADNATAEVMIAHANRQVQWRKTNEAVRQAVEDEQAAIATVDRWRELRHKLATMEADFPLIFAAVTNE